MNNTLRFSVPKSENMTADCENQDRGSTRTVYDAQEQMLVVLVDPVIMIVVPDEMEYLVIHLGAKSPLCLLVMLTWR